jgi:hypothetical protein
MRPLGSAFRGIALFSFAIALFVFFQARQARATTPTQTSLASSLNPSTYGQSVTFTATVIPVGISGTVTGNVTFKDTVNGVTTTLGTQSLSGGVARGTTSALIAGTHTITAFYNGNATYSPSTGTLTQTVNKATTTTTLTSSLNPSNYLQSVTFTATVTGQYGGTPTGTVTFSYSGGTLCTSALSSAVATCATAALTVGSDLITGAYNGDNNYLTSTGTLTQTVNRVLTSITVAPQSISASPGAQQQYAAAGHYNDGTQQNITTTVTWASSNTSAATITASGSSGGLATAVAAGSTNVTATLGAVASSNDPLTVYSAGTFFVAPNGNDSWNGDLSAPNGSGDGPFASISRAQYAVQHASKPATVYVRAGTYYPALTASSSNTYPGTLIFTSADSGTSTTNQVTWAEYPADIGTPAVISGGVPANTDPNSGVGLQLTWTHTGNWYKATLPLNLPGSSVALQPFESLYYNGERRMRARVHDTGVSTSADTYSVGYYMSAANTCTAIGSLQGASWQGAEFNTALSSCNLGSFIRVTGTITPGGTITCPSASDGNGNSKCLDRFYYLPSTGTGADAIDNWSNLTSVAQTNQPCSASTTYPAGDVELTLIGAWTMDVARVNCVDTTNHIIYLVGTTKAGNGTNYNFMGPTIGHRFVIENSYDAFTAAQSAGQVGIWFLDRSAGAGNWVLNYVANTANGENPTSDYIVIPQLPQTGTSFPAGGQFPLIASGADKNDYIGGSLLWATGLEYVTFNGITFESDNFYPNYATSSNNYNSGFNNDFNGEMPVPQAIDCENCQFVTFNGVTVRHTSASGLLAGATATTTTCSTNSAPTTSSFCVLVENSSFYDLGDSGVRIGHYPQGGDTTAVAQDVLVQNNRVTGFSRVLADGEGITQANGYYNQILSNTVIDGYHAGISICYDACGRNTTGTSTSNGSNVYVNNNLVSNLMQGITSDGGSIYFNVGGSVNSATGDEIHSNVVYDTTDSYIIDVVNGSRSGTGYGGEGIYLDAQTADVDVENNVVFNVDGNAIHLTEGLASSTETANTFKNNIFAFGNQGMFTQNTPWPTGCPAGGGFKQVVLQDNLFVFDVQTDQPQPTRGPFRAIQGCTDSCQGTTGTYSNYQSFAGNNYWSDAENWDNVSDAFKIQQNQGPGGLNTNNSCSGASPVSLYFSQTANNWQTGTNPINMDEDAGSTIVNPTTNNTSFPTSGTLANVPADFSLTNWAGLGFFNGSYTNSAISGAGSTVSAPSTTCSSVTPATTVCPTFPTYVYGISSGVNMSPPF